MHTAIHQKAIKKMKMQMQPNQIEQEAQEEVVLEVLLLTEGQSLLLQVYKCFKLLESIELRKM